MKNAIITGASSGIGAALVHELAAQGVCLGLMARRSELLLQLQNRYPDLIHIQPSDFTLPDQSLVDFKVLWDRLGHVDYVFLNAGISRSAEFLNHSAAQEMIHVNIVSFTYLAEESMKRFTERGEGHLIGVSSIAGTRGSGRAPIYGASKAYISHYLQGLRQQVKAVQPRIRVTDIRPGFVDTAMVKSVSRKFWLCSATKAAQQIISAVKNQKRIMYVSRRWRIAAIIYAVIPEFVLEFFYARYLRRQ